MRRLSIVTVCFNAEREIEKTIQSILKLEYEEYEYIIKDGNSCDSTNKIIENYKPFFIKKGIKIIHIKEKDNGIYAAMNQALKFCTGEWIQFLNAGDIYFNSTVISDIFLGKSYSNIDVIYGHTCMLFSNKKTFIAVHNILLAEIEKFSFCHQSIFMKRVIFQEHQFDEQFSVCADQDLIFKLLYEKKMFKQINCIVAVFSRNGVSSKNLYKLYFEKNKIYKKNKLDVSYNKKNKIVMILKSNINKICPVLAEISYIYKQMGRVNSEKLSKNYKSK